MAECYLAQLMSTLSSTIHVHSISKREQTAHKKCLMDQMTEKHLNSQAG